MVMSESRPFAATSTLAIAMTLISIKVVRRHFAPTVGKRKVCARAPPIESPSMLTPDHKVAGCPLWETLWIRHQTRVLSSQSPHLEKNADDAPLCSKSLARPPPMPPHPLIYVRRSRPTIVERRLGNGLRGCSA